MPCLVYSGARLSTPPFRLGRKNNVLKEHFTHPIINGSGDLIIILIKDFDGENSNSSGLKASHIYLSTNFVPFREGFRLLEWRCLLPC
ncbi:hypothetical protein CDAR_184721 [Caerostris darwini]|uniref:Uncharacterized protein n=1 Tax=Caerostris darwini TaxID=1538125 RepID=A0AAV4VYI5_9ARAC|nr:hypothetical protein CDAR_184721 [Caerostris darwini]